MQFNLKTDSDLEICVFYIYKKVEQKSMDTPLFHDLRWDVVVWYSTIQRLSPSLGVVLNKSKLCKILTDALSNTLTCPDLLILASSKAFSKVCNGKVVQVPITTRSISLKSQMHNIKMYSTKMAV